MPADGDLLLLAWTQAERSATYRLLLDALAQRHSTYAGPARLVEVCDAVAEAPDVVEYCLEQLVSWGNVVRTRDTLPAADLRTYEQRAYTYELTSRGLLCHRTVTTLEEGLQRGGGLHSSLLPRLPDLVGALGSSLDAFVAEPSLQTAAAVQLVIDDLDHAFQNLRSGSQLFMQSLNSTLADPELSTARLSAFKVETIDYLRTFVDDLEPSVVRTRAALDTLPWDRMEQVLTDVHQIASTVQRDPATTTWPATALARLASLRDWFTGGATGTAGAFMLADRAVAAVVGIVAAVERLTGATLAPGGHIHSLLQVARDTWAAEQPSLAWAQSTGLVPARHWTLGDPDAPGLAPRQSWQDAAPVTVPTRLRTTGRADYIRRASRVRSTTAADDAAADSWVQRAQDERDAEAAVLDRMPWELTGTIDLATRQEFDIVTRLLETALRSPGQTTPSADGRYQLSYTAGGGTARISCADGTLTVPAGTLQAVRASRSRSSAAASAPAQAVSA